MALSSWISEAVDYLQTDRGVAAPESSSHPGIYRKPINVPKQCAPEAGCQVQQCMQNMHTFRPAPGLHVVAAPEEEQPQRLQHHLPFVASGLQPPPSSEELQHRPHFPFVRELPTEHLSEHGMVAGHELQPHMALSKAYADHCSTTSSSATASSIEVSSDEDSTAPTTSSSLCSTVDVDPLLDNSLAMAVFRSAREESLRGKPPREEGAEQAAAPVSSLLGCSRTARGICESLGDELHGLDEEMAAVTRDLHNMKAELSRQRYQPSFGGC